MASKNYQASETSTVWTSAGGDKLMDMGGMIGTPIMGAYLDLGASPRADWYEVVVKIGGGTWDPDIQDTLEVRFSQSNSTTGFDGPPTTDPTSSVEGTMTIDQVRNCKLCRTLLTTSTTAADVWQCRFRVRLTSRYVSPVMRGSGATPANNTGTLHSITLTPIPRETQ